MSPDPNQDPGDGGQGGEERSAEGALAHASIRMDVPQLGRELGGDLPCVVCGYNLRGLSIRSVCPECGAGVRATILSVVDPQANVLRPIRFPRLVAGGLMLWSTASLVAAVVCWAPELLGVLDRLLGMPAMPDLSGGIVVLVVLAGIGVAALVRPHSGIPIWHSVAVVVAVGLHIPLAWALASAHRMGWQPTSRVTVMVATAMSLLAGIFLLIRPTARLLVARSLLLRSGRVDRQTLYGMAAAAAVVAVGHAALWVSAETAVGGHVVWRVLGLVLLLTGTVLLTMGLLGSVIDSARIAHAIVRPRMTVRDVVRRGVGRAGERRERTRST